jgi:hypothetical protein
MARGGEQGHAEQYRLGRFEFRVIFQSLMAEGREWLAPRHLSQLLHALRRDSHSNPS